MQETNRNELLTIDLTASVVSIAKEVTNPRKVIILCNTSLGVEKITICVDGEAQNGNGVVLSPGGVWQDSAEGGYTPTQKQITAISNVAGASLSVYERLGV